MMNEFRIWLQSQGLAPETIRYYVADVRACLLWFKEHPKFGEEDCDNTLADRTASEQVR